MRYYAEITGKQFGRLTAIASTDKRAANGSIVWNCSCICGGTKIANVNALNNRIVQSCGCLHIEKAQQQGFASRTHGDRTNRTRTVEYRAWDSMKQRCLNENTDNYSDYGGRGITICERWMTYQNFLDDMGRKPAKHYSLDRIDVDGNYEPSNCRWATPKEQANNTRRKKHAKS